MISIVVCTHNGTSRIESCISALISQENPPEYEIIVVDNASTDRTGDVAEELLQTSFRVDSWRIIQEEKQGLLYARIAGLTAARYEWVLFCDDDNILFPDFLSHVQSKLENNSSIGVLGSFGIPVFLGPEPEWFNQYSSSFAVGPQKINSFKGDRLVHVYGACSTYRKKPLLDLFNSGFKPILSDRLGQNLSSGGDVEWCWIMQLLGFQISYSKELKFYHKLPKSRLNWEYYIRLKKGISSSVGLLNSYTFYFHSSNRSFFNFKIHYYFEILKSILRVFKNWIILGGRPKSPKDQLAFEILNSKMEAFRSQKRLSFQHYKQLTDFFGS